MRTIVLPLPWRLSLLLKLETRISPGFRVPPWGKWSGTKATPEGLRSPLSGTVETLRIGVGGGGMICPTTARLDELINAPAMITLYRNRVRMLQSPLL